MTCNATKPNGISAPGEPASPGSFGGGGLFTELWPDGVVVATKDYINADGTIHMKWPWFRSGSSEDKLAVTGVELTTGAPVTAEIPDGYGYGHFQPSGLIFPGEGCYRIDARWGGQSLSIVTEVRRG